MSLTVAKVLQITLNVTIDEVPYSIPVKATGIKSGTSIDDQTRSGDIVREHRRLFSSIVSS